MIEIDNSRIGRDNEITLENQTLKANNNNNSNNNNNNNNNNNDNNNNNNNDFILVSIYLAWKLGNWDTFLRPGTLIYYIWHTNLLHDF